MTFHIFVIVKKNTMKKEKNNTYVTSLTSVGKAWFLYSTDLHCFTKNYQWAVLLHWLTCSFIKVNVGAYFKLNQQMQFHFLHTESPQLKIVQPVWNMVTIIYFNTSAPTNSLLFPMLD